MRKAYILQEQNLAPSILEITAAERNSKNTTADDKLTTPLPTDFLI
jgi:hypothetical protein